MKHLRTAWAVAKIAYHTLYAALEIAVPLVAVAIVAVVYLTINILGKAH